MENGTQTSTWPAETVHRVSGMSNTLRRMTSSAMNTDRFAPMWPARRPNRNENGIPMNWTAAIAPIITVRGDGIRLDLRGVHLTGLDPAADPDLAAGTAIRIDAGTDVSVRGGTVRGTVALTEDGARIPLPEEEGGLGGDHVEEHGAAAPVAAVRGDQQLRPGILNPIAELLDTHAGEVSRQLQGTRIGERQEDKAIIVFRFEDPDAGIRALGTDTTKGTRSVRCSRCTQRAVR